jgi:nicotinamide phosphoribosyltransferase
MRKRRKGVNPLLLCDFYKIGHREQYPEGTEKVYSTWTARGTHMQGVDYTVAFGLQRFVKKYLIDYFRDNFFNVPMTEVANEYRRVIKATLGTDPSVRHINDLWQLGYLPLRIRAVPEGTLVPLRVPWITVENTHPNFFWLTNFIESLFSAELWQATTSATIANEFRKMLDGFAGRTNPEAMDFVAFQGHDFSFRGMSSLESACSSGLGHLLSFTGTDTIPAILEAERYYGADVTKELVGTSIPATEHSVMCCLGPEGELDTYKHLLDDVYPTGFISIVSDTYNLWTVLGDYIGKELHDRIMARDGKLVVRPDSGDPVLIMAGDESATDALARKGVIETLWDTFGGTMSSTGYKVLDPHIGAIYGDAITYDRAKEISLRLAAKGFASTNTVFGIGSFTYQYNTRDTFQHAIKAGSVEINGVEYPIWKDPVTDSGTKKSLAGRVAVVREKNGMLRAASNLREGQYVPGDILEDVFIDGKLTRFQTLAQIREILRQERNKH